MFINDFDKDILSRIAKFANDTKLGTCVDSIEGVKQLQADLDKLSEWATKWQMAFNVDKCEVMHIGSRNPHAHYLLMGKILKTTKVNKDLGCTISDDLKAAKHCSVSVGKAKKNLGFIKRTVKFKSKEIIIPLCNSLVRSHLEYGAQFWSPYLRKDNECIEKVYRRATKMIPSIRHKSYEQRREDLNMFSLEQRRLRGQLIEVYKMINKIDIVDFNNMFTFSQNQTRGNGLKLELPRYNTDVCGNFFTYRIPGYWNKLSELVVNSPSIDSFKKKLDKVLPTLIQ
jgi:hypothetical protein